MSKVALSGNASGTGTFTIASPNGNTDRTLNLPDSNGTILTTATPGVPVNGPAFYAIELGNPAPSVNTWTKITANTEVLDTNGCYSSSRFTPNIAGYYSINASAQVNGTLTSGNYMDFALYKNGSKYGVEIFGYNSASYAHAGSSNLVYLNGSTDYVELYFSTTQIIGISKIAFGGFLARSAT